jgi:hypothetical protein
MFYPIFFIFCLKLVCSYNLLGDNDTVTTIRPITPFNKIIIGSSSEDELLLKNTIDFKLIFVKNGYPKLSINTDLNLQRFIQVESNGEYLTFKFDKIKDHVSEDKEDLSSLKSIQANKLQIELTMNRPLEKIECRKNAHLHFMVFKLNSKQVTKNIELNMKCASNMVFGSLNWHKALTETQMN